MKYLKIFEDFSKTSNIDSSENKVSISDEELSTILNNDKYCNSKYLLNLYRFTYNFTDSQIGMIKDALLKKIDIYLENDDIDNLRDNIIGIVINKGYDKGLNTYNTVFGFVPKTDMVSMVLCEVVGGGTLWLNYNNTDISVGGKSDIMHGLDIFMKLRKIKNNN